MVVFLLFYITVKLENSIKTDSNNKHYKFRLSIPIQKVIVNRLGQFKSNCLSVVIIDGIYNSTCVYMASDCAHEEISVLFEIEIFDQSVHFNFDFLLTTNPLFSQAQKPIIAGIEKVLGFYYPKT